MKYCPYCGAGLMQGAVSFCQECGKALSESTDEVTVGNFAIKQQTKSTEYRRTVAWQIPGEKEEREQLPAYDGYYDDILPEDHEMNQDKPEWDKTTIFKIGLIAAGVLIVAAICAVTLILL